MATNQALLHDLRKLLGPGGVLHEPDDLLLYEYDASVEVARPLCVVFPRTTEEVVAIVHLANRYQIPLVGRGAGTGLSGGALARQGGIVQVFSRMNRILEVDVENQRATVQPGLVNADLSAAVAHTGLHFAPDPSSQKACTIGGNVSENSGGPHTLAYGVTTNHVLALQIDPPTGEQLQIGSSALDAPGYDLLGLFVGSEGTLALVTEITVKLTRLPESVKTLLAVFDTVDDATETVAEITARGITPAACEMLDGWTLRAVEAYVHAGFPLDAAAVLLIDIDGPRESVETEAEDVADVCRLHHAREVRVAQTEGERQLLWKGRKNAFGAVGRISPTYYTQDAVIPRTKLPATLRRVEEIGKKYGFQIGNIFHAGDGNLHPLIPFDGRDKEQLRRAIATGTEIVQLCIEMGGSITGEHGVGMEKDHLMPLMFTEIDLHLMRGIRNAFNPAGLLNPRKDFSYDERLRRNLRAAYSRDGFIFLVSMASLTASARLAGIAGPAHVAGLSADLADYDIDGKRPAAMVRPGSTAEVAEIVKFAAAEDFAVVPFGARTKPAMGAPLRQYDLAVDVTRLARIVAYDPGDLTLSVEPGVPLREVASVLAEHNQWLPLEAPFMNQATIGGTVSAGVDGPLRQMYGTARDYILGMEFVTGDGAIAKSGGRVVKNVTGYDVHKLMIGALGTLAIISKINFRTFPSPRDLRGFAAAFKDAEPSIELRHRIARSPFASLGLEVFSPTASQLISSDLAAEIVENPVPAGLISGGCWILMAEFSGNEKILDRVGKELREMAGQCGCVNFTEFRKNEIPAVLGRKREFVPIGLHASAATTVLKITVLPTRMNEALGLAGRAAETNELPWAAMARGLGIIYFVLLPEERNDEIRRRVLQTADQILLACKKIGGNTSIPWCPAEWEGALKVWGLNRDDFDAMRKLKAVFDPQGILAPGRFAGGL